MQIMNTTIALTILLLVPAAGCLLAYVGASIYRRYRDNQLSTMPVEAEEDERSAYWLPQTSEELGTSLSDEDFYQQALEESRAQQAAAGEQLAADYLRKTAGDEVENYFLSYSSLRDEYSNLADADLLTHVRASSDAALARGLIGEPKPDLAKPAKKRPRKRARR